MKTIRFSLIILIPISLVVSVFAQTGKSLSTSKTQSNMVDDKNTASLNAAKNHFDLQRTAANPVWKMLTNKQKQSIYNIEAQRDKKLIQLDANINATKVNMGKLKLPADKQAFEKLKLELNALQSQREKTVTAATNKIRAQLNAKQKAVYNNYQLQK